MAGLFGGSKKISMTENKIGALRVQNSSQGLPVPIVFGKTRITSNLLWYDDFTAIPSTEVTKTGGKGGGGTTTENTTYTYTVGVVFGLHEGPAPQANFIGQVWSNKDVTDPVKLGLTEFTGSYAQTPWSYLTTNHANQALAYRGQAYAATGAFQLGSSDGLPNLSFEVVGFGGDADQNVADVVEQMLTADKYGAGWPTAQLGDLTDFFDYCAAAGFVISPAYVAQQQMSTILSTLAQIGNSGITWSDGLLKFIPYADANVGGYVPDLTVQYSLTYDDFIADRGTDPVKLTRKRQADAYNSVKVECIDRSNQYNTYIAEAKDQWAIDTYGLRPMEQLVAHEICDPAVARTVAQTILQRVLYVRNVYSFTLGWKYGRLEPMDIVALTDPALGLLEQPVRIISIEEDDQGTLSIEAEELSVGVSTPGVYVPQTSNGTTPQAGIPPGNATAPVMFQPPIAMTGGVPQVWLGTAGGPQWGGAEVWVSSDGTSYQRVGVATNPARFGVLTANLPSVADPDTTSTLSVNLSASNGVLTSAPTDIADSLGTLSYVAGANTAMDELVAFSTANLTAPYTYALTGYLRRAQKGTTSNAHASGANFMRLDEAVVAFNVPPALFGTMIYVKLLSYNTVGGALQDLADVNPYTFNVAAQVLTNGTGYAYIVDRTSVAPGDPGNGRVRFNNASQANTTALFFDQLTADGANMAAFFDGLGPVGLVDLRSVADSAKWASYEIVASANASGYHNFGVEYKAGGVPFPEGDTIVATFSPTLGVLSVGLNLPATLFAANATQVTSTGNLSQQLANQSAGMVFAGPITGNAAAAPTFRALVASDLPAGGSAMVVTTITGNHTFNLGNFNQPTWLVVNSGSNVTLTVPSNANAAVASGSSVVFSRKGNGSVNIAAQANVTVNNASSSSLRAVNSVGALTCVGTDEWDLFGDLT